MDIQLADGLSLQLCQGRALHIPTIFSTAHDRFARAAFEALAVDYLLKPVGAVALAAQGVSHFSPAGRGRVRLRLGLLPAGDGGLLVAAERAAALRACLGR